MDFEDRLDELRHQMRLLQREINATDKRLSKLMIMRRNPEYDYAIEDINLDILELQKVKTKLESRLFKVTLDRRTLSSQAASYKEGLKTDFERWLDSRAQDEADEAFRLTHRTWSPCSDFYGL